LAKPKQSGGWGFKNNFSFEKALAAKSFWCGLFEPGLWNEVIKEKYLNKLNVIDWIRLSRRRIDGI